VICVLYGAEAQPGNPGGDFDLTGPKELCNRCRFRHHLSGRQWWRARLKCPNAYASLGGGRAVALKEAPEPTDAVLGPIYGGDFRTETLPLTCLSAFPTPRHERCNRNLADEKCGLLGANYSEGRTDRRACGQTFHVKASIQPAVKQARNAKFGDKTLVDSLAT
jgi:hypothetical protein